MTAAFQHQYGVLDVETTIFQKGNPYAARNKLCIVGLRIEGKNYTFKIEYDSEPYGSLLSDLARALASCHTIVGFNCKFDLAWLNRYGISLSPSQRVFDCQLAHFILTSQQHPFPSLNDVLGVYNLGSKLDIVEREYWDLGIDTPAVPLDLLTEYLHTDLEKTDDLYRTLSPIMERQGLGPLVRLHMQDLRVLLEMECSGLVFDWSAMEREARAVEAELKSIDEAFREHVPSDFRDAFNPQSGDHLSALLYGGSITTSIGSPYNHTFKSGPRSGESVTRYRWRETTHTLPRIVKPPEGSGLAKDGFFSTDEETLKSIETDKASRVLVNAILRRATLEKYLGTYLRGISAHIEKYDWQDQRIHGTFNQCRVITGRLSSEKPNQQNFPDEISKFIVTRF